MSKILCVGFHKTGTSSLGVALEMLGYKVKGHYGEACHMLNDKDYKSLVLQFPDFDAFQDNPWPLLYKEFDKLYPDSKFILTVRDSEEWYNSILKHFAGQRSRLRHIIYNGMADPAGNKEHYLKVFENHYAEVKAYFADRPDDLLMTNINDLNWSTLCGFLDKPKPDRKFPHANSRFERSLLGTQIMKIKMKFNLDYFSK